MSAATESASTSTSPTEQSQTLQTSVAAHPPEWAQDLPPDLKSMVQSKGYKTLADLAQAYGHAEKAFDAESLVVPKDGVWDAGARAKLGIPERADGYRVNRPAMPPGVGYDESFERSMLPVAHKLGLMPAQVQ